MLRKRLSRSVKTQRAPEGLQLASWPSPNAMEARINFQLPRDPLSDAGAAVQTGAIRLEAALKERKFVPLIARGEQHDRSLSPDSQSRRRADTRAHALAQHPYPSPDDRLHSALSGPSLTPCRTTPPGFMRSSTTATASSAGAMA